ncbi:MAG: response regulator [Sedimentisphaerales bacterium]
MDKILIVQDSRTINALLSWVLKAAGFAVVSVETGEEGVEKAKKESFQLVLLDYRLPGISGVDVCNALKKDENTRHIPIVFMSASNEEEIAQIAKDTGAEGYIIVPFEEKGFIEKIKSYIENNKCVNGKK